MREEWARGRKEGEAVIGLEREERRGLLAADSGE